MGVGDVHRITWVTASPLWGPLLGGGPADPTDEQRAVMASPSILRFESDQFMEELAQLLASSPESLVGKQAGPVSYRVRPPGEPQDWEPDGAVPRLKLYQPFHGHFNLVAASLVCQTPGLPDRAVQPAQGDRVSFVLRRLYDGGELAWVDDPIAGGGKAWSPVDDQQAVATGEELLPLFPISFADGKLTRRLFVGLIPTSSRDAYRNTGPAAATPPPKTGQDARLLVLIAKVRDPLDAIRASTTTDADAETASPFVALELAEFLVENLAGWQAILEGAEPAPPSVHYHLYGWLRNNTADRGRSISWLAAVRAAWADRLAICGEQGTSTLKLNLKYAATGVEGPIALELPVPAPAPTGGPSAPDPAAQPVPKLDPRRSARYVLRCAYQRPQCGPLHEDVVSDPSQDFAIASHFDIDAPHRRVTISLPIDTSPAGLRKFPKSVTFLLSDQLKQQMTRLRDLKSMSEGSFDDGGGLDIGLVCSFSIPIITICALLILMIFIQLLNIVFWWLPFFKICLPLGLSKGDT
jgi:hypothetical protein